MTPLTALSEAQTFELPIAGLLLCALSLGLYASRQRWLAIVAEEISWALFTRSPDVFSPSRRIVAGEHDAEPARASWPRARRLVGFLAEAGSEDQRRAVAAAERALAGDARLLPLTAAVEEAVAVAKRLCPRRALESEDAARGPNGACARAGAAAAAEVVATAVSAPLSSREALSSAWDAAAPERKSEKFTGTEVLPVWWLEFGADLRTVLGLTFEKLVPEWVRVVGLGLAFVAFTSLACLLARCLAVWLGSSTAFSLALFLALGTLLLDALVLARRPRLNELLSSPEQRALRSRRLEGLCAWADGY